MGIRYKVDKDPKEREVESMPTVLERVKAVVVDKLGVSEEAARDISGDTSFIEGLNADSLDLVELIMVFEEKFSTPENSLEILDDDAGKIQTIKDAVAWLKLHGVQDTEEEKVPTR